MNDTIDLEWSWHENEPKYMDLELLASVASALGELIASIARVADADITVPVKLVEARPGSFRVRLKAIIPESVAMLADGVTIAQGACAAIPRILIALGIATLPAEAGGPPPSPPPHSAIVELSEEAAANASVVANVEKLVVGLSNAGFGQVSISVPDAPVVVLPPDRLARKELIASRGRNPVPDNLNGKFHVRRLPGTLHTDTGRGEVGIVEAYFLNQEGQRVQGPWNLVFDWQSARDIIGVGEEVDVEGYTLSRANIAPSQGVTLPFLEADGVIVVNRVQVFE
jgi:hypothetical protein